MRLCKVGEVAPVEGQGKVATMFLSTMSSDEGFHELDFRFEMFPEGERFLFAHHGAKLNELMKVCGLPSFGSTVYMVEMAYPLSLPEIIANKSLLEDRYLVGPAVVYDRYLRFESVTLARFFENTKTDTELDCTMIGTDDLEPTKQDIQGFLDAMMNGPRFTPLANFRCWLHTHDNHFLWFATKSIVLLRRLIAASLGGFFNHVYPHSYTPVPEALIDLILSKYHTVPLVCFPTAWDEGKGDEVAAGVQLGSDGIQALVETAESSWIAHQLNPPKELVGRGLLISYNFQSEAWSFDEWR